MNCSSNVADTAIVNGRCAGEVEVTIFDGDESPVDGEMVGVAVKWNTDRSDTDEVAPREAGRGASDPVWAKSIVMGIVL